MNVNWYAKKANDYFFLYEIMENRNGIADTYKRVDFRFEKVTSSTPLFAGEKNVMKETLVLDKASRFAGSAPNVTVSVQYYTSVNEDISGFTLYQDTGTACYKVASAGADGKFGQISYDMFNKGLKTYISATSAETGKVIATKQLLIKVINSDEVPIPHSFSLGDGIKVTLTGWPFEGRTLELPVCDWPITAQWSDDGKLQAGINVDITNKDKHWLKKLRDPGFLKDMVSNGRNKQLLSCFKEARSMNRETKLTPNLAGYLEYDFESGKWSGQVTVELECKVSQENQAVFLGVPLVFELSGGLKGSGTGSSGNIVCENGTIRFLHNELSIKASGTLGAYGGAGFAYVMSGGFYGSLTAGASARILPAWRFDEFYIEGEFGIKGKGFGHTLLKLPLTPPNAKWYLYRRGGTRALTSSVMSNPYANLMNAIDYDASVTAMPRADLQRTGEWNGDAMADQSVLLQSNVYPDAQLQMTEVDGGLLAVFLSDDSARAESDRSMLVWSRYDEGTRTWSVPSPVWQDGTADYYPTLCQDGNGGAYIAWSNARSPIPEQSSLSEIARLLDVSVAHFDASTTDMHDSQFVSADDNAYEMGVRIAVASDGHPFVAWYENDLDAVFGSTGNHRIICCDCPADLGHGDWESRVAAVANGLVTDLATGDYDGMSIAWATDEDGIIDTPEDSSVSLWTESGNVALIDGDSAWNPRFAIASNQPVLAWGDGQSMMYKAVGEDAKEGFEGLPYTNWSISGDIDEDCLVSYLWYEANAGNVLGRVSHNGEWTEESSLVTRQGRSITSYAVSLADGRPQVLWASDLLQGDESVDTELWFSSGSESTAVTQDSVYYDDGELDATITNAGAVDIPSAVVSVSENGTVITTYDLPDGIRVGESQDVAIELEEPSDNQSHAYEVSVSSNTVPLDSPASQITIGKPMLAVEPQHLVDNGVESVTTTITNIGASPTSAGTVRFYNADTEETLATRDIPALGVNESCEVPYATTGMFVDESIETLGICATATDDAGDQLTTTEFVGAWGEYDSSFDRSAPGAEDEMAFIDVNAGVAHKDDIAWLARRGISSGWRNADGTKSFRPSASVVRADMAAFLFRLAKKWGVVDDSWTATASQQQAFTDVDANISHAREIWWLASQGVSTGWKRADGKREFRPYAPIARQDMAAFLFRLAKLGDKGSASDQWTPPAYVQTKFCDVTSTTPHAREIWWLAQQEISTGWNVDGRCEFRGMQDIVRCDMAAFLRRTDLL